jgi:hypothetical protein
MAITGLGGVGKTQITVEVAYRVRERKPECSIFWIPSTSIQMVEQACMSIGKHLGLQPAHLSSRTSLHNCSRTQIPLRDLHMRLRPTSLEA